MLEESPEMPKRIMPWRPKISIIWSINRVQRRLALGETIYYRRWTNDTIDGKMCKLSDGATGSINNWWDNERGTKRSKFHVGAKGWNQLEQLDLSSRSRDRFSTLCDRIVLDTVVALWLTETKRGSSGCSMRSHRNLPCGCMVQNRGKNFLFPQVSLFC